MVRGPGSVVRGVGGFTMLELILTVSIMAAISTIAYLSFATIIHAWQQGNQLTETLHHGDFMMEQLVMGLKSTYYPDTKSKTTLYGFWMEDHGDGLTESDMISWVKEGTSLVGANSDYARGPHRVKFTVEETEEDDDREAVAIRAWRLRRQLDDFKPDEVEPVFLPGAVIGFNCRTAFETNEFGEIDWLDDWEKTNRIPLAVEVTLYLEPLEEGGDPVEVKRALGIPVAPLSEPWK